MNSKEIDKALSHLGIVMDAWRQRCETTYAEREVSITEFGVYAYGYLDGATASEVADCRNPASGKCQWKEMNSNNQVVDWDLSCGRYFAVPHSEHIKIEYCPVCGKQIERVKE